MDGELAVPGWIGRWPFDEQRCRERTAEASAPDVGIQGASTRDRVKVRRDHAAYVAQAERTRRRQRLAADDG